MEPVGYTFADGYALCADCVTPDTDVRSDPDEVGAVFAWDEAAEELTCEECGQILLEAVGYIRDSTDGE